MTVIESLLQKYAESETVFRCRRCWQRIRVICNPPSLGVDLRRYSHLTPTKKKPCNCPLEWERLYLR